MIFATLDFEIADRILPSFCSISALLWENGKIVKSFHTFLNPDCDIEDCMKEKHKITYKQVKDCPYFEDCWKYVNDIIKGKVVFLYKGNQSINNLLRRLASCDQKIDDIQFASVDSLCRKIYNYSGEGLDEFLCRNNIKHNSFNSLKDSYNIGQIVLKAIDDTKSFSFTELFDNTGFNGGFIVNNQKILYRAIKNPDKNDGKKYLMKTLIKEYCEKALIL